MGTFFSHILPIALAQEARRAIFIVVCFALAVFAYGIAQHQRERAARSLVVADLDENAPSLRLDSLATDTILLNFWASWCLACRNEHAVLTELARDRRVTLIGINSQDDRIDARRWLNYFGDPFCRNGYDPTGALARSYGVNGLPATLVVSRTGDALHHHVGPLDAAAAKRDIAPHFDNVMTGAHGADCPPASVENPEPRS